MLYFQDTYYAGSDEVDEPDEYSIPDLEDDDEEEFEDEDNNEEEEN